MSSHVPPHRWADTKISDAERVGMDHHAERCTKCAQARDRIASATGAFSALRTQSPPELAWDTIRARVHWSVSSERRSRARQGRGIAVAAWSLVGAGAIALGLSSGSVHAPEPTAAPVANRVVPPAPEPAKLVGLISRLAGEVMIDGIRRPDAFDRTIGAGALISTADGRVDIQFGEQSAFAIGPRSSLEVRRFDAQTIELAIEGTVDIEVSPRAHGQRFLVIAGDQTVEVRGTQFRVVHAGATTQVACRHGLVAVRDARGEVEVAAARAVDVHAAVGDAHVVDLSKEQLAQLAAGTPHTLAVWTNAETLSHTSAPLEIASVGRRDVRVDGIELGEAPLRVRVMPGRHTIEAIDSAGRFRRAGWVDVDTTHAARLEVVAPEQEPIVLNTSVAQRKKQLHAGIDRPSLKRCIRAIAKQVDAEFYVDIEIAVDATGAVSFLNILNSDLQSATQSCVHQVLSDVRFATGPAATWREKIEL